MLGRHRKALALLGKLFKQGKVGKTYWAVVAGGPAADEGRIDIALSKRDESRGWWMKPDPHGLPSVTMWRVMGRSEGLTWLALEPVTGRTHQLRVHCAEMGFPIVGDNIYGSAPRVGGPTLHLHAREVVVPISKNKPAVTITAPVPPPMDLMVTAYDWMHSMGIDRHPYARLFGAFRDRILGNPVPDDPPPATFADGVLGMKVMDAVRRADREGTWVPIPT